MIFGKPRGGGGANTSEPFAIERDCFRVGETSYLMVANLTCYHHYAIEFLYFLKQSLRTVQCLFLAGRRPC